MEFPEAARWSGPIGFEGVPTGDGRLMEKDSLRWENLPLPFRHTPEDNGSHDGAIVVGLIDKIERRDDGVIWGEGPLDMGSDAGREAYRLAKEGYLRGVSMDLDDVSIEVRIAKEIWDEMNEALGDLFAEEEPLEEEDEDGGEDGGPEIDDEGRVTVVKMSPDDEVTVVTSGRIRAATLVDIPAFHEAQVTVEAVELGEKEQDELAVLVASAHAIPNDPPSEWFYYPEPDVPTALTVTEEGQVYGHLALWGIDHIGHAANGQSVHAPRSMTNYAYFHLGVVVTEDGKEVPTGKITLDTKHAGERWSGARAAAHYDHTGTVTADVRAMDGVHGVWLAGALRPGVTPAQIRALRAAPLSGDWRDMGGNLELVAALSVNVPGFPVPRPAAVVASGRVKSLVAAGMVPPRRVLRPGTPGALSEKDLYYLKRLSAREERADKAAQRAEAAQRLARRVKVSNMARKVLNK